MLRGRAACAFEVAGVRVERPAADLAVLRTPRRRCREHRPRRAVPRANIPPSRSLNKALLAVVADAVALFASECATAAAPAIRRGRTPFESRAWARRTRSASANAARAGRTRPARRARTTRDAAVAETRAWLKASRSRRGCVQRVGARSEQSASPARQREARCRARGSRGAVFEPRRARALAARGPPKRLMCVGRTRTLLERPSSTAASVKMRPRGPSFHAVWTYGGRLPDTVAMDAGQIFSRSPQRRGQVVSRDMLCRSPGRLTQTVPRAVASGSVYAMRPLS